MDYSRDTNPGDEPITDTNHDFAKLHWTTDGVKVELKGYKIQIVMHGHKPRSQTNWENIATKRLSFAVARAPLVDAKDAVSEQPQTGTAATKRNDTAGKSSPNTAQVRKLSGKIIAVNCPDEKLKAECAITVKLFHAGIVELPLASTITDKDGRFSLKIPADATGKLEVRFEKVGYMVVPPRLLIPPVENSITPDLAIIKDDVGRSPSSYALASALRTRMASAGGTANALLKDDLLELENAGIKPEKIEDVRIRCEQ